jgi:hypothetical protein
MRQNDFAKPTATMMSKTEATQTKNQLPLSRRACGLASVTAANLWFASEYSACSPRNLVRER